MNQEMILMTTQKEFFATANKIAEHILNTELDQVLIISHIDADGLCAASIASTALNRKEIKHHIKFVKQLDDVVISELDEFIKTNDGFKTTLWFTDLGSGMNKRISHFNPIISDHHAPSIFNYEIPIQARTDLLKFSDVFEHQKEELHLNPHLFNLDGTYDISGSGTVYLIARAMDKKNIDLAYLAVVGAVGDLQDSRYHRLVGTNRIILEDAKSSGIVGTRLDISAFGRETRTIQNVLMYATDPYLPGLTMNEANCLKFLSELNVPIKDNGRYRRWVELTFKERRAILSGLMELLLSKGIGHKDAKRLFGEVYILPGEHVGTPLHDAKEFATLLNSCGKYSRPEVGFQICLGDRKLQLKKALELLKGHKSILMEGMQYVKELGIKDYGVIQFFNADDKIPDNVVGTIVNMMLSNNDVNSAKTLFGFVQTEDGNGLKVSARGTRELVNRGLNLSEVMRKTSETIGSGSVGGGHDIAAGATIPLDKQEDFLRIAEELVRKQLRL